jgi:hypothetical protein
VLAMVFQYFLGGKKPETPEPEAKPQDNTNKLKKPLHVRFSHPPEKKKPTAGARKKAQAGQRKYLLLKKRTFIT